MIHLDDQGNVILKGGLVYDCDECPCTVECECQQECVFSTLHFLPDILNASFFAEPSEPVNTCSVNVGGTSYPMKLSQTTPYLDVFDKLYYYPADVNDKTKYVELPAKGMVNAYGKITAESVFINQNGGDHSIPFIELKIASSFSLTGEKVCYSIYDHGMGGREDITPHTVYRNELNLMLKISEWGDGGWNLIDQLEKRLKNLTSLPATESDAMVLKGTPFPWSLQNIIASPPTFVRDIVSGWTLPQYYPDGMMKYLQTLSVPDNAFRPVDWVEITGWIRGRDTSHWAWWLIRIKCGEFSCGGDIYTSGFTVSGFGRTEDCFLKQSVNSICCDGNTDPNPDVPDEDNPGPDEEGENPDPGKIDPPAPPDDDPDEPGEDDEDNPPDDPEEPDDDDNPNPPDDPEEPDDDDKPNPPDDPEEPDDDDKPNPPDDPEEPDDDDKPNPPDDPEEPDDDEEPDPPDDPDEPGRDDEEPDEDDPEEPDDDPQPDPPDDPDEPGRDDEEPDEDDPEEPDDNPQPDPPDDPDEPGEDDEEPDEDDPEEPGGGSEDDDTKIDYDIPWAPPPEPPVFPPLPENPDPEEPVRKKKKHCYFCWKSYCDNGTWTEPVIDEEKEPWDGACYTDEEFQRNGWILGWVNNGDGTATCRTKSPLDRPDGSKYPTCSSTFPCSALSPAPPERPPFPCGGDWVILQTCGPQLSGDVVVFDKSGGVRPDADIVQIYSSTGTAVKWLDSFPSTAMLFETQAKAEAYLLEHYQQILETLVCPFYYGINSLTNGVSYINSGISVGYLNGTYKFTYLSGAATWDTRENQWNSFYNSRWGYMAIGNGISASVDRDPATVLPGFSSTSYPSAAAAETACKGMSKTFTFDGSKPIYVGYIDGSGYIWDNLGTVFYRMEKIDTSNLLSLLPEDLQ